MTETYNMSDCYHRIIKDIASTWAAITFYSTLQKEEVNIFMSSTKYFMTYKSFETYSMWSL